VPDGPITVGILEDHRLMLQSLIWLLEGAGFVVTAKSGDPHTFLAQIAERPPQVALIDLTLESFTNAPTASGVEVVRELRENHPEIRTLVLSATHTTEMVDRCYHEGAAGYLYKLTATRETLTDAIREVAMGKRLFPVQLLASSVSDGPSTDRRPSLLDGVTDREREVLAYLSTGADNVQIAKALDQVLGKSSGAQAGIATIDNAGQFFAKRTGPIIAIASGQVSGSDAKSLLGLVNYEANVTWNENTYFDKNNSIGTLLVNIILLCFILGAMAIVAGVAFGGFRILMKRLFPDKLFDRPEQMEFISLHLAETVGAGVPATSASPVDQGKPSSNPG